ncbi:MAG: hypothetical protein HYZ27_11935, partial [Deltaproteobacteria bacterium]|nr:hypothetical protein [Deltaproteobacteria bacterium]
MNRARALSLMVALTAPACQRQVHGTASLYLYNATPEAARVHLQGNTAYLVDVRALSGEIIDNVVA